MKFTEVKAAMDALDVATLAKTKEDQQYRWYQLMLLFELYAAVDSMSHSYREMLKIQQGREAKQNGGKA